MYNTTMCIWAGNQLYGNRLDEKIHDYKKLSGVEPVLAEDIETLLDIGITKILWYDEVERIESFFAQLSPDLFCEVSFCTSKPIFLEFFSKKVSKAMAMGNAAKEVKESAQFITATNDEDGVKKVLVKFFTGEGGDYVQTL